MKDIEYVELADRMIRSDKDRDALFDEITKIRHMDWNLPDELEGNTRKVISSDPYDAVESANKALSSLPPKLRVVPLANNEANKERAGQLERNLLMHLYMGNSIRSVPLQSDTTLSALLYMSAAVMVIDLDWQIQVAKELKKNTDGLERARRDTRFVFQAFNPRDVHVKSSVYGIEKVLLCQKKTPHAILDEWGDVGKGVLKQLDEADNVDHVYYYDMMGTERAIWFRREKDSEPHWIMKPEDMGMDFLPWAALFGASSLEPSPGHQFHPMLYPLVMNKAWETQNIVDSIMVTDAIAVASLSKIVEEGPNPDYADIDYTDPAKHTKAPPGNTVRILDAPEINRGMTEIRDRIALQVENSTVSKVIRGGRPLSGTSYSAQDLTMETALNQLRGAMRVSERTLDRVFKLMLEWVKHTGEPLESYEMDEDFGMGTFYELDPATIDPSRTILRTELTPNVPVDDTAKANAANIWLSAGASHESVLDQGGFEDPKLELERRFFEDELDHMANLRRQEEMMMMQMGVQMQAQMQAQQAQQQQQMQEQAMQEQAMMQQAMPQGQGFNPAQGGTPPVQGTGMPPEEMMGGV